MFAAIGILVHVLGQAVEPAPLPPVTVAPAETSAPPLPPPQAIEPVRPVLSLSTAEKQALAHQAQIAQAQAQTAGAYARLDESRAQLLPQVNAQASYARRTANYVSQPGTLPNGLGGRPGKANFDTVSGYNFSINASQLVYDFGQTYGSYQASRANAESQHLSEETVRQGVLYGVRSAFVLAWANRALVDVDRDALKNQDRHLAQVQGQVQVGTRPEIDLAQVRADRASAALALINAEANYTTAKAQLNQAMGVEGTIAYDVATDRIPEVAEEQMPYEQVAAIGVSQRPELKSLAKQAEGDERQLSATKGAYGPSLGVSTGLTEAGADITAMAWNWNAQATLQWQLFQGGVTNARVREAAANQAATRSQTELERQQVRLDAITARLAINTGTVGLSTAKEIESNARERLRLAEARYQAGAGSIIELQDAQVAATTASGQVVQADYTLSLARAQLLKAIGRR